MTMFASTMKILEWGKVGVLFSTFLIIVALGALTVRLLHRATRGWDDARQLGTGMARAALSLLPAAGKRMEQPENCPRKHTGSRKTAQQDAASAPASSAHVQYAVEGGPPPGLRCLQHAEDSRPPPARLFPANGPTSTSDSRQHFASAVCTRTSLGRTSATALDSGIG